MNFSAPSVTSYNTNPPTDDGAVTENNRISWAKIKVKLSDPLNTWAAALKSSLDTTLSFGKKSISGVGAISSSHDNCVVTVDGNITLPNIATLDSKFVTTLRNISNATVTITTTPSELIDGLASITLGARDAVTIFIVDATNFASIDLNPIKIGDVKDCCYATMPSNYLACDGSAVSRTTYAALFAKLSTTYGTGDGSTTFNLPDFRGRVLTGTGAATFALKINFALGEFLTLGATTHKYYVGQALVYAAGTTPITNLTNGVTYYIAAIASDTIKLSTSPQDATSKSPVYIDFGLTGALSGTLPTLTYTAPTSLAIGAFGGEEQHRLRYAELPEYGTDASNWSISSGGGAFSSVMGDPGAGTQFGGATAHNNMPPYGVATKAIRAL